jgi:hypothetical protein
MHVTTDITLIRQWKETVEASALSVQLHVLSDMCRAYWAGPIGLTKVSARPGTSHKYATSHSPPSNL